MNARVASCSLLAALPCATAFAIPPRYICSPVNTLHHVCNPQYPEYPAPTRGYALASDGRVAADANCGSTMGGSRPFVTSASGVVTELPHGTFTFTQPAGFLANGQVLLIGDWCPPVTGTCTTALAIASSDGTLEVLAASSLAASTVSASNEYGWAAGWGGVSASDAWRIRPEGTLESLHVADAWGLSVGGVSPGGFVGGSAYVSNQSRAIRWDVAGNATVLPAIERGTAGIGAGIGADASVLGASNGRAAWWRIGASPVSLLPVGSASIATKMAGNPMTADPLGFAIFGTHQSETKIFRATGANFWSDLGPNDGGTALTDLSLIAAPRPDFIVAQGFTAMYQPSVLLWSLDAGMHRLESVLVNPPAGMANAPFMAVAAIFSRVVLANAGFNGAPYLIARLEDGDTNGDHLINGSDLAVLLSSWGVVPASRRGAADFDGNGLVDGGDLAHLLALWN